MTYLQNPDEIYAKSFAIIRAEVDLAHLPANAEAVAVRVIHACGMVDIANDLRITSDFAPKAKLALAAGQSIFVDAEMVRQGIIPRFLTANKVVCTLNDPRAREIGIAQATTRSAAAVTLWKDNLEGTVVVIGNAPTALFRLLELIDNGAPKPGVIVGFPVGFVGAAESKEALINNRHGIAYATIRGRKGGSAMASAVINALLDTIP